MINSTDVNNTKQPLLSIKNGYKYFGGITALENVDFEINDQEILALLGDNGAGKSTLIKTISGAYTLDKGDMFFEGKKVNIKKTEDAYKLGIKTVYQDLALFDILDVTTNLFAGAEITRWGFLQKKKMQMQAINVLGNLKTTIKSLKQEIRSLSGGQQHSVAIARGVYIGQEPKLIIMDEPTAGLGVKQSREVLKLLAELKNQLPIIFITHNLDFAFEIADKVVILSSGRVVGKRMIKEANKTEIVKMMMGVEDPSE